VIEIAAFYKVPGRVFKTVRKAAPAVQTIPAREIKRRGISAVDGDLARGPVHVIKDDRPSYVILDETQYQELLEAEDALALARVRAALEDVAAGQVRRVTAQQLIAEHDLNV